MPMELSNIKTLNGGQNTPTFAPPLTAMTAPFPP
jgi:hypothetical protein